MIEVSDPKDQLSEVARFPSTDGAGVWIDGLFVPFTQPMARMADLDEVHELLSELIEFQGNTAPRFYAWPTKRRTDP